MPGRYTNENDGVNLIANLGVPPELCLLFKQLYPHLRPRQKVILYRSTARRSPLQGNPQPAT